MIDLGTLPDAGGGNSYAEGINDLGEVAGYSANNGFSHAFIYSDGTMADLNSMIDPNLGITVLNAIDINNAGQIIGNGFNAGTAMWTRFCSLPCPNHRVGDSCCSEPVFC